MTVGAAQSTGPGQSTLLSAAQLAVLTTRVNAFAASLHASAVPLETSAILYQVGMQAHSVQNFTGPAGDDSVYVATPQLLATCGIMASQIAPGTDILTMRPGNDPSCGYGPSPGADGGRPAR